MALLEKLEDRKSATKRKGSIIFARAHQAVENYWDSWDPQTAEDEARMYKKATMVELLGENVFDYFEERANNQQLALFLDFIQAYLDADDFQRESGNDFVSGVDLVTNPLIEFAIVKKRIDFVNLMIPTPLHFDDFYEDPFIWTQATSFRNAVKIGDIEMVKLLMKYSREKHVNINARRFTNESTLELATRLGHYHIAQLLQDVNDEEYWWRRLVIQI